MITVVHWIYDSHHNQDLATPANPSRVAKKKSHVDQLVRCHLDTDSEAEDEVNEDPNMPWKAEFDRYMDTHDIVPNDMSIVHWWGVSLNYYLNYEAVIWFLKYVAKCISLSNLGYSCTWLLSIHGLLGFKWASLFYTVQRQGLAPLSLGPGSGPDVDALAWPS